jgi:hypothetical protein
MRTQGTVKFFNTGKDQPMATLAVVVALGFVLGALWKSK